MVQIWYMEPYPYGDPRLPHHLFPPKKITPNELTQRTGTLYFKVDTTDPVAMSKRIALLKKGRKLMKEDIYTIKTVDFDDKIDELFEETSLPSEMALLIMEGSAYYDVEDGCGNWLRILCEYGDLLIIPAEKLHRFTTTTDNYVKMRRFFKADK